ncbi:MAG: FeoA family protein [Helicobacteraceae bacterium]|jgi:ferrous iron transport protein A|nr:FeoA family protein [Helicobacteraceae bacterium]
MNTLTKCPKGCETTITKLHATGPLKQRLVSFGIMKGATITLMEYAPRKSTVEVKVGKMRLALRKEEADMIEVEYAAK